MGKIVDLHKYRTKQLEKNDMVEFIGYDMPQIYVTKTDKNQYNVIMTEGGVDSFFNQVPLSKLSLAIYAASYCKDKLSEYFEELLSTDIIRFDEECTKELNME